MDPVTLILAALMAGASPAVGAVGADTRADVTGVYTRLVVLVRERLGNGPATENLLAEYEEDPQTWEAPLKKKLTQAGAADDERLVAMAQQLMALLDTGGARAGKYRISVSDARGVQVGDHNTQTNTFGR